MDGERDNRKTEERQRQEEQKWGCRAQTLALVGWLGGWVCPTAIHRNGPRLRKPWRSGIKVCVCGFVHFLHPFVHVWCSGSRAAVD